MQESKLDKKPLKLIKCFIVFLVGIFIGIALTVWFHVELDKEESKSLYSSLPKELGNNLILSLDESRFNWKILYCEHGFNYFSGCMDAGSTVVKGQITQYAFNQNWVVVYAEDPYGEWKGYWIIDKCYNKNSDINEVLKHILGPLNEQEFEENLKKYGITLKLQEIKYIGKVIIPHEEFQWPPIEDRKPVNYRNNTLTNCNE